MLLLFSIMKQHQWHHYKGSKIEMDRHIFWQALTFFDDFLAHSISYLQAFTVNLAISLCPFFDIVKVCLAKLCSIKVNCWWSFFCELPWQGFEPG